MKIDLYLYHPRQEEMPARARQTERGGFDGLFVAESTSDPFQCLAVASPHTSRVTLGTSVALAFPRSPMLTAVAAWDLQRATHGRHILGLGSQVRRHIERRFSAPFTPPAARLREYAQAVRHVWGAFQQFGLSATVLGIVDEDAGEAAREAVRRQFAFYASTPAYRPVLELHGWEALGDKLRALVRQRDPGAVAAVVPDEILDEFCVNAPTWAEAIDQARRRYDGLVDRVMFQAAPPAPC